LVRHDRQLVKHSATACVQSNINQLAFQSPLQFAFTSSLHSLLPLFVGTYWLPIMGSKAGILAMRPLTLCLVLLFAAVYFVVAIPTNSSSPGNTTTSDVDICSWIDGTPLLYHEYSTDDCPPKYQLQPDGSCEDVVIADGINIICGSYCQIRMNFYYGQEQPYVRVPLCRGSVTCTLSQSVQQSYSWKKKINGSVKIKILTMG